MTNAIGTGTCNLPINLPVDCRAILGRSAVARGARSTGAWVKRLLLRGLEAEDPKAARALRRALNAYYSGAFAVLVMASAVTAWWSRADFARARGSRSFARLMVARRDA